MNIKSRQYQYQVGDGRNRVAFVPAKIFDGEQMITGHAVLVKDKKVEGIISVGEVGEDVDRIELEDCILAPAFIDLQI